jgi:O-antigen/teichoic acid export membrane protein
MKRNNIENFIIYTIMAFIQKGMAFFMIPLYVIYLSPSDFGAVNQWIALGSFYLLISTFALDEAAVRFYFETRKNKKNLHISLSVIIIISLTISIIITIFIILFKKYTFYLFISNDSNSYLILISIIVFTSPIISIYQKLLRIQEKVKRYTALTMIYSILQIFLSILFIVVFKLGAIGYLLAFALSPLSICIYSFYMILKEIGFKLSYSNHTAQNIIRYSAAIVPHTFSSWGIRGFTIIALGKLLNSSLVGIFSAMNFISIILNVFSKALMDAYQPWAYKKFESGAEGIKLFVKIAHFIGFSFVIIGLLFSLGAEGIIKYFINDRYHDGIPITPILIYSSVVLFLGSIHVYSLYFYKDYTKYIGVATITGAMINITSCFILIPKYGIVGGAISIAISNLIISIIKQYFSSKALNVYSVYIELYILATFNAIIAYFIITRSLGILPKLIIACVELSVFIIISREILNQIYQIVIKIILSKFKKNYSS